MSKIRLGILGAGKIARIHLDILLNIKTITISKIFSRTSRKARLLAKKYSIKEVSDSLEDFMSKDLDGILVLVSADQIFKVVKKLLPYKIPLFIEKPIALNLYENKRLIQINKKYKTKTMVGLNRRFYSIFKYGLRAILKKGNLLGVNIEGHERFWKYNNSLTITERQNWIFINSIHAIDLIRFFGGEIKEIKSFKKKLFEKNGDQFNSIFKFKSGAIGSYISNWYSPGGWSVTLFGNGITVIFKPLEEGYIVNKKFKSKKILPSKKDTKFKEGFYDQMLCFIKMITSNKLEYPGQSIEQTYNSVLIINKLIS